MDDPIRRHVVAELEATIVDETLGDTTIRELEDKGLRIVSGGQTGPWGDDGRCPWQVTDWRTGEVRAGGAGTLDEFNPAWDALDPDEQWIDIDRVGEQVPLTTPSTPGLPPSLARALADWIGANGTLDEEIAEFVGWDVAKVHLYRSSAG